MAVYDEAATEITAITWKNCAKGLRQFYANASTRNRDRLVVADGVFGVWSVGFGVKRESALLALEVRLEFQNMFRTTKPGLVLVASLSGTSTRRRASSLSAAVLPASCAARDTALVDGSETRNWSSRKSCQAGRS